MPARPIPLSHTSGVLIALLPIMAAISAAFAIVGIALPVLPLHVYRGLGFDAFVVGLVAGSQFAASLVSRLWAGSFADNRGPKLGVIAGLLAAAGAGLLYLVSSAFTGSPIVSVTILVLGRALLGGAESFIITSGIAWGLVSVGSEHAGKVIAWVGMAMFAAFAVGAPIGTALYAVGGFAAVSLTTALVPLAVLPVMMRMPAVRASRTGSQPGAIRVARAVLLPGLGAALSSIGYAAMLAFSSLLFASRGWEPVWLPFTAFAAALIAARVLFGHLPDKLGGARVALIFALIETGGLLLMSLANGLAAATLGAALVGFGYSLVFPGLGAEAIRGAPPESRGLAMGFYTAFLDVAMGFGSPLLGLVASGANLGAMFFVSALLALGAAASALYLIFRKPAAHHGHR